MEYYRDDEISIEITKIDGTRRSGYVVDVFYGEERQGYFARTKRDAENLAKKLRQQKAKSL